MIPPLGRVVLVCGGLLVPALVYTPFTEVGYQYRLESNGRGLPMTPSSPPELESVHRRPMGYFWVWETPRTSFSFNAGTRYECEADFALLALQCGAWLVVVLWFVFFRRPKPAPAGGPSHALRGRGPG